MNSTEPLRNSTPYRITAIILASGKGSRYGQPKSEARLDGKLFSDIITDTLRAAGLENIVLADHCTSSSMLDTLKQTITDLPAPADFYLVIPVDHPHVQTSTIAALVAALSPGIIVKPVYHGQSGHPVIIPAALDLSASDHEGGLRGIIAASLFSQKYVEVEDPGILINLNHPPKIKEQ
ncbi:MAG TPA: NTP transferase domain-containing protein [Candidatus Cloacimonadota bacterium]|nr:NTP transferase domain-containing protein [Candidatus Cloacimonadota bacterium]